MQHHDHERWMPLGPWDPPVCGLVDLVGTPVDAFAGCLGDDIRPTLKQQRDAVGKAVHIDAGLHVAAANTHCCLNNERMALKDPHITCMMRQTLAILAGL